MKNILYITANSKPEKMSSSKTVGRKVVERFLSENPDIKVQEVDLYQEHIPRLVHSYFESRSTIIDEKARSELSNKQQQDVHQIIKLCDQFIEADIYVLAAPMWSLSFPAPVKEYIDCILQTGKTIEFHDNKPHGLLDDKERLFIYVQSSGANIPWIIRPAMNKGLNYVHDVMKFIGIKWFEELLVDGTGTTEEERQKAIKEASDNIDKVIKFV